MKKAQTSKISLDGLVTRPNDVGAPAASVADLHTKGPHGDDLFVYPGTKP